MGRSRDRDTVPLGATVIAENGDRLGTVHAAYRHFFLVESDDASDINFEVSAAAVEHVDDDRVLLKVNREALTRVPREDQTAAHRMHEE